MPLLTIKTNGMSNDMRLVEKAADLVADVLGKSPKVVAVSLEYNHHMAFDGAMQNKGAMIELGAIGIKDKALVVAVLTEFAVENLGVKRDLVCVSLTDLQPQNVAHGGKLLG